ncbi:hypothetical protein PAPYR_5231 [Paratrimastix pyriformis]|uniref:Proteinase inhibitor I42 chagasin domain-containing protein n=1 Tax=Paratrimastix pyriformis TaxID=342808 RepID=A0ABQ8UJG0_9EUKA|nr:hypothetical protein PAPYR_5231 [Paratrimastix pyriformis]
MKCLALLLFALPLLALAAQPRVVKQGEEFTVEMPANPTTGYRWVFVAPPEGSNAASMFTMTADTFKLANLNGHQPMGIVGGGGFQRLSFRANQVGNSEVHIAYVRPWEVAKEMRTNTIPADLRHEVIPVNVVA